VSQHSDRGFHLTLVGPPRVVNTDGAELVLRSRKHLALLFYLAVEQRHNHSRDHLLGLFWPEADEQAARNNLRVALADIRQALREQTAALLQTTRHTVQFSPLAADTVDVLQFRALLDATQTHPHATFEECSSCLAKLQQAVHMYRGQFLHGFHLPDSTPFEEWVTIQREGLHQKQLAALESLTLAHERRGDYPRQVAFARQQIALEPWREHAYAQLMRGLWALGERGAALEQYETCRRILADELGLEPSPELTKLAIQLRRAGAPPTRMSAASPELTLSPEVGQASSTEPTLPVPPSEPIQTSGWHDIPAVTRLYGRASELERIQRWLLDDRCRLVALLGIGGVGKTTIAAVAANAVAGQFAIVIWRTLLNAPPLDELLRDVLGQLIPGAQPMLPTDPAGQITLLVAALRNTRCLLVLDNLESLLRAEEPGVMRVGYEGYAQLLRAIAERSHQSCVLLTSRERPQGLARLEEDTPLVRLLRLDGLDAAAATELLVARGLATIESSADRLVQRYSGNPLALRLVSQTVREVFDGDIHAFLAADTLIFDDIGAVLEQQVARLAPLERELLIWLAILREPTSVQVLQAYLVRPAPQRAVIEAVRALLRRSLVVQNGGGLALQNVITEYLTERLIIQIHTELPHAPLDWMHRYALLTTAAPEYVRQSQIRLIVEPIARQLAVAHGTAALDSLARHQLDVLRATEPRQPSYAAGNLLNLLTQLQIDIHGYDFSNLSVWQADLREVAAFDVDFSGADLGHGAFSDIFDTVNCVAFSPDGALVAAGSGNGIVGVWRVVDGQRHALFTDYRSSVASIAFSPDRQALASASSDAVVRIWDVATGELRRTLVGHTGTIRAAWIPGTTMLASCGNDHTLRVWDTLTGNCLHVFDWHAGDTSAISIDPTGTLIAVADAAGRVQLHQLADGAQVLMIAHPQRVHSISFSTDGRQFVTGCFDTFVRVWETSNGQLIYQLEGHRGGVYSVSWSPDGNLIATGGYDTMIRIWNATSGEALRVLRGHIGNVNGLDWSPNGRLLVSAGHDETIRLWNAQSGDALRVLQGNAAGVLSLAFGPNSAILYSTQGHAIRSWDVAQRRWRRILRGHRDVIARLAVSADGAYLASAGRDFTIRLWDAIQGRVLHILAGHTNAVQAVAFAPDGRLLASASTDASVRLWDARRGQVLRSFNGHTGWVETVCFSIDGTILASGSADGTVRLWDVQQGQELSRIIAPQQSVVRFIAISPDGVLLACASNQGVLLCDMQRGQLLHTLVPGRTISCVAWSPDGAQLAAGTGDHMVWLWDREGWAARSIGKHLAWISAMAWSPDGALLASCSTIGEITLWDGRTGTWVGELHDDGPYAGTNITGTTGITDAQRASLIALGAHDGAVAADG
jgi:WD40 repeat protein/DNA-binding SARP family transcriptional activator